MNTENNWVRNREELRNRPTTLLWEIELRRLLNGQRRHILRDSLKPYDYVETLIRSAQDHEVSRSFFSEAFYRVIDGWQPTLVEGPEYVFNILDLIANFAPQSGLPKVIDFLNHYGEFDGTDAKVEYDLTFEAMRALEGYYPSSPQDINHPAFTTYVNLLQDLVATSTHTGYAITRLIAIGIYNIGSKDVRKVISKRPNSMRTLVAYWLGIDNQKAVARNLTQLYNHCLILDAHKIEEGKDIMYSQEFVLSLAYNRAVLIDDLIDPVIRHRGKQYMLPLKDLSLEAQRIYKTLFLDKLINDPEFVAEALSRMFEIGLIKSEDEEIRTALLANSISALEVAIHFGRRVSQENQSNFFSSLLYHCLRIDDPKGELDVTLDFKDILRQQGLNLYFGSASMESEKIIAEIGTNGTRIPLNLEDADPSLIWKLLEVNAIETQEALQLV